MTALDGLVIKKVGPAYSPQLLDRLELLTFIQSRGVRIFSDPLHIARVLNRLSCTVGLSMAGIPMPPTVVTENVGEAAEAVRRFGQAVFKPLYTSKARGMAVLEWGPTTGEDVQNYKASSSSSTMMYIQKMIDLPGRDLGLVFLGGQYLATYARVGKKGRLEHHHGLGRTVRGP